MIVRQLVRSCRTVAVVAPAGGPLEALRRLEGVRAWVDGTDPAPLVALRRSVPDLAVVVDGAEALAASAMDATLREITSEVDRTGGLVVCGAEARALAIQYRGLAVDVARARTGILLGPASPVEGDVFGVRVPAEPDAPPGRGHLVRRGHLTPIQVALPAVPDGASCSGLLDVLAGSGTHRGHDPGEGHRAQQDPHPALVRLDQ
jgi:S-DNA-T family DNA segregation ATPase FtsK/SpoIIIE